MRSCGPGQYSHRLFYNTVTQHPSERDATTERMRSYLRPPTESQVSKLPFQLLFCAFNFQPISSEQFIFLITIDRLYIAILLTNYPEKNQYVKQKLFFDVKRLINYCTSIPGDSTEYNNIKGKPNFCACNTIPMY